MEYLKHYIDVDKFAVENHDLFKSDFFQRKVRELIQEKNKRNIPNISDGSRYLLQGIQAVVNIEKVKNQEDDCVFLIDFGNVMDYGNNMTRLLIKYNNNPL